MRLFTLLVLSYTTLAATIINIPGDYETIQAGIDSSNSGDTIVVDPGTYFENVDFSGKNIVLTSNFLFSNDTLDIIATIIDGNASGSVVSIHSSEDSTAQLVGFSVTNGYSETGAGIFIDQASPTISHCNIYNNLIEMIDGNLHNGQGAGVFVQNSSSNLNFLKVKENNLEYGCASNLCGGGGIYINSSSILLASSEVSNNYLGTGFGAGIRIIESIVTIFSSRITHNSGSFYGGGGIDVESSTLYILNTTISSNSGGMEHGGAGLSVHDMNSLEIVSTIIQYNDCLFDGGGVRIIDSPFNIINSTISYNEVGVGSAGAGIHIEGGNGTINGCTIRNNSINDGGKGAGMNLEFVEIHVSSSSFINNGGVYWNGHGGACAAYSSQVIFQNCLFDSNKVATSEDVGYGSVMYTYSNATSLFRNCTIVNNHDSWAWDPHSNALVVNSILWNNLGRPIQGRQAEDSDTTLYYYSDTSWESIGLGNINIDPLFIDPENGDYSLQANSACVDAGTSLLVIGNDTIVQFTPSQYLNSAPDIGYLEYGWPLSINNNRSTPQTKMSLDIFPNPFNSQMQIQLIIAEEDHYELIIFDLLGHEVYRQSDMTLNIGKNILNFDAFKNTGDPLQSGLYICQIKSSEMSASKRIVLLK